MTRTVFSDEVANLAKPWRNRKIKRPFQFVVGLVRSIGGTSDDDYRRTINNLAALGQKPFNWPAPNGYPDSSAAWAGDLYNRWTFATAYAENLIEGLPLDDTAIMALQGQTPTGQLAVALDRILTGGRTRRLHTIGVQNWLNAQPTVGIEEVRDALGLLACTPSYQLA